MKSTLGSLGFAGLLAFSSTAFAATSSVELQGIGDLGSFEATATYTDTSATTATFVIEITNTSSDGWLTALAFNNPGGSITDVTMTSTDSDFVLLGALDWDDNVNASPYGQFDIASATGGSWQGSGNPSLGIASGGGTATFTFSFTGTNLNQLTVTSFFGDGVTDGSLSEGTGAGEGYESFVVRFRGFANDGSDKVPADVVPIPPAAALFLTGIGMLAGWSRRRKASRA